MANLQGLYLVEPHGRLIAEHRKTLIAKSKHLPLEGDWLLLSKDNGRGLEYGKITVGQPRVVAIDKFDSLFQYHRVTPKERSKWWPTKIELYLYPITNLEPHDEPKPVGIPAGTQTIVEKIKYLASEPSEPKKPKEPGTDVEPGQDRERPYSEVGAPRAGDTHSDPAEKEIEPEHEQKEARMPWTTADPPSCAKNWAESEKKKCIKAANAVLRDGGKEQDAIFACIRAAGKTKHPGGEKAQKPVGDFLTLQAYLDSLNLDEIMVKMIHGCETVTDDKARGEGQGVGGPPQGDQGAELCVCPKCGHETKHERGTPCAETKCPECGTPMQGKSTEEKAANQADWLESRLHQHFTVMADDMFGYGQLTRDERLALSSLIGDALDAFHKGLQQETFADLRERPIHAVAETEPEPESESDLKDEKETKPNDMLYEPGDSKGVNTQDATKGGRRLQSSKLEFLGNLKGKLESLLQELGTLIGWASYDDQKPIMFQGQSGFKALKAKDGRTHLLTWTMNAFKDREHEIFTLKSIEDYVARNANEAVKGTFDFWHIPYSDFGKITWQGIVGRFLVESGPFDGTLIGQQAEKFFLTHAKGHSGIAPEGWGTSHAYVYRESDKQNGVYTWFDKRKTTVLPRSAAANVYNPELEVTAMGQKMDQKQRDGLVEIWGEETAAQIIKLGESETKELEQAGVATKEKGTGSPDSGESQENKEGKSQETKGAESTKTETDTTTESKQEVKEIITSVADELQLGALSEAFKAVVKAVGGLGEQVQGINTRLDALEVTDEKKLAEKEQSLPRYAWFRASQAAETVLEKDDALKSARPQVPEAISRLSGTE